MRGQDPPPTTARSWRFCWIDLSFRPICRTFATLNCVHAGRADGHVAGSEAEEPVAEQVIHVLLDHDPERVVRLLPRPDRRADAELALAEDQVQLAVVHQDGEPQMANRNSPMEK